MIFSITFFHYQQTILITFVRNQQINIKVNKIIITMQTFNNKTGEQKEKQKIEVVQNMTNKSSSKTKPSITDLDAIKIMEEVDRLLGNSESLQGINLLRALKENMHQVKNQNLHILVILNLGILYYQVGFLEEAYEEFSLVIPKLKQMSQKILTARSKDPLRMKYETILGKLELQICILYSQLGKHDLALEHARISSKTNFNLIFDILTRLYTSLNKILIAKNYQKKESQQINLEEAQNILNSIGILTHLLNCTKDLKLAFAQKEKLNILEEQIQITKKYGFVSTKFDIEELYNRESKADHFWIYKNKILDEIQLVPFDVTQFQDLQLQVSNSQVIQKITFLAISLYCYSTQTRFIQKQKNCDSHDVLDSQHWLSRSLQIAYSFLPPEAPILNQIITVHDRFHGLDKQTIPQDEEVTGFFKVLKPLSKPKSTYSSKNPVCSPIMIRIQAEKIDVQVQQSHSKTQRQISLPTRNNILQIDNQGKIIDLEALTKNNKIRNFSHGHKRMETADAQTGKPYLSARTTIDAPLSVGSNIRSNYVSKKFGEKKKDKLKLNFSQLNGKAVISEDLLSRPHSLQDKKSKMYLKEQNYVSNTDRKKKSLPARKSGLTRKPNILGNTIKYEGLELKGHKMQETIEGDFFERIGNGTRMMETTRIGGNVYINNNINLFISRNAEANAFGQTYVRGQVLNQKHHQDRQKEMSRRQIFLNKRRANNFIAPQQI